ncbi:DUF1622 domain-containing protein [Brevundimonas sp. 2R-24]|uniref:DUF1622 domain-containing protein n=1 Tax=Peiella sedimenti TaxID=3061083 RepID=A0ABT8SQE2_9CAUL|nr:DUF1622 domain-containing protein [Caulobacteraceae bacterium XZ-24]
MLPDAFLKDGALFVAVIVEAVAALIIAVAVVEALWRTAVAFGGELRPSGGTHAALNKKLEIRLRLGRWLTLALEFLLAADILKTAVAPTWDEIGKLAAIAALRTALNYFLQREIEKAQASEGSG